jgi:hypothetical protein
MWCVKTCWVENQMHNGIHSQKMRQKSSVRTRFSKVQRFWTLPEPRTELVVRFYPSTRILDRTSVRFWKVQVQTLVQNQTAASLLFSCLLINAFIWLDAFPHHGTVTEVDFTQSLLSTITSTSLILPWTRLNKSTSLTLIHLLFCLIKSNTCAHIHVFSSNP